MESLYMPLGFRVLDIEICYVDGKNAPLCCLGSGCHPLITKSMLTMPTQLKRTQPVCLNAYKTSKNTSRSSSILSCSKESGIVRTPEPRQVVVPHTDSVPRSTGSTGRPRSDQSWNALEIADAVSGEIVRWGPPGTICTDSRKLMPGQWFFAISGENFDGHDFVDHGLVDKGCAGVIGNRVCEDWDRGFIRVEGDTSSTLDKMARFARNRFSGVIVGLTGSVGKTTTRTMIALALESLGHVYQTRGNLNYMVGVAMTLIGIPLNADAAVVELGMSGRKGEILEMARMCKPSVRVILNVGHCHMNYFNSLEDVARAKGELLMEANPGDICVLNADDPLVMSIPVPFGVKKVFFGQKLGSDVRLVLAESVDGGCAVRIVLESEIHRESQLLSSSGANISQMVEFKIHGPGLHLAMNACAAAAVAISLGVPLHQIAESLSRFRPVSMRSEMVIATSGIRIINDTYNASVCSMVAAIKSLESIDCSGKRVAVLGDMLELGSKEEEEHELVLKLCCDASSLGLLILAGERFLAAAEKLKLSEKINLICSADSESLVQKISGILAPGDVALVKGSRAMHMERIVDAIKLV